MIDIHSHILPRIDDGPQTLAESLEMLSLAWEDGITEIAATPHIMNALDEEISETVEMVYNELVDAAKAKGIPLKIHLGSEIFITPDIDSILKYRLGTYNGKGKFVLIEFGFNQIPFGFEEMIRRMVEHNITPIIAHPERNHLVIKDLERAKGFLQAGGKIQVTSGSLLGQFGKEIRKSALSMLENDLIYAVATDAHDSFTRPPVMSPARRLIESLAGKSAAEKLTLINPRRVLKD